MVTLRWLTQDGLLKRDDQGATLTLAIYAIYRTRCYDTCITNSKAVYPKERMTKKPKIKRLVEVELL